MKYPNRLNAFFLGALACLSSVPFARAQFAVYGQGQAIRFDNRVNGTATWFGGGTFGLYDDFFRLPVLGFGADVRGTFASNGNVHYRSGLVGLRADARAPVLPFRPYLEGLIGVGGAKSDALNSSLPTHYDNKFEYEVLGGLDFTVFPHLNIRLPEIGWGQVSPVASSPGAPNSRVLGVSAGVVLRLF